MLARKNRKKALKRIPPPPSLRQERDRPGSTRYDTRSMPGSSIKSRSPDRFIFAARVMLYEPSAAAKAPQGTGEIIAFLVSSLLSLRDVLYALSTSIFRAHIEHGSQMQRGATCITGEIFDFIVRLSTSDVRLYSEHAHRSRNRARAE